MTITPETAGAIDAPNTLNSESAASVAIPNALNSETAGSVAAPNALTSETAGSVSAPNTLTSETASSVAVPNTLTSETAGAVAVPNTLSSESAASVAVPNTIGAVAAAGLPRTLTPMLKLDFADDSYQQSGSAKTLLDIVTYSRASSATFINRQVNQYGQYEYFIDNDYVGDVENLITYSEQFDNAAWAKSNATVAASAAKAPDGTMSADKLTAQGGQNGGVYQFASVVSGNTYTFSFYAKRATSAAVYIRVFGGSSGSLIFDNYHNEIKDTEFVLVQRIFTATNTENLRFYPVANSGSSDNIALIWGAQLTESAKVLPYVKTVDTTVTKAFTETVRREYDPETGKNLGALIEGGSTNLLTRSEEFDNSSWIKSATVTANATKAPDGTTSADKLTATTTNSKVYQAPTVTSGQEHTYSAYFKNIDSEQTLFRALTTDKRVYINWAGNTITSLSGVTSGATASYKKVGDFYRVDLTFTTTSTSESCRIYPDAANGTGSVYAWGAQLEQKPFATSYIRTEGAAVSRAGDALSVPSAGNYPELEKDKTVLTKVRVNELNYNGMFFSIPTGSTGNARQYGDYMRAQSTTPLMRYSVNSGGSGADTSKNLESKTTIEAVLTLNNGAVNVYQDKELTAQSASAQSAVGLSSFNILLGSRSESAPTDFLYGHIAEFSTYNTALTAQEVSVL